MQGSYLRPDATKGARRCRRAPSQGVWGNGGIGEPWARYLTAPPAASRAAPAAAPADTAAASNVFEAAALRIALTVACCERNSATSVFARATPSALLAAMAATTSFETS